MSFRLALILALACSGSEEPDSEMTSGSEDGTTVYLVSADSNEVVGSVTLSDEETAELNRRNDERRAQRETELERQREEFRTECGAVTLLSGPPPAPPPTPTRASLRPVEAIYQAALLTPPQIDPASTLEQINQWASTTFQAWVADMQARLAALEQGASALTTEEDLAIGGAWLAHAYGTLSHAMDALPVPRELENDPQLLAVYRDAFRDPIRAILSSAEQALGAFPVRDPSWLQYTQQLDGWVDGLSCALHPGRP